MSLFKKLSVKTLNAALISLIVVVFLVVAGMKTFESHGKEVPIEPVSLAGEALSFRFLTDLYQYLLRK